MAKTQPYIPPQTCIETIEYYIGHRLYTTNIHELDAMDIAEYIEHADDELRKEHEEEIDEHLDEHDMLVQTIKDLKEEVKELRSIVEKMADLEVKLATLEEEN